MWPLLNQLTTELVSAAPCLSLNTASSCQSLTFQLPASWQYSSNLQQSAYYKTPLTTELTQLSACSKMPLCPLLEPLVAELKEAEASNLGSSADRSLLRTALALLVLPLREETTFEEREE